MIYTTININLPILIPIVIAIITAIIGPIWLARHKETVEDRNKRLDSSGELSVRIIDEGRDMRKELRDRVDSLEDRLAVATQAFQDSLDEIRRLKSENERCSNLIRDLREEVDRYKLSMSSRVDALEHPTDEKANDDKFTDLSKNGDIDGPV